MSSPIVTPLPAGPNTLLWGFKIIEATEVIIGSAVIVVLKHEDGTIGIGNIVRRRDQSVMDARERCLFHALGKIGTLRQQKVEQQAEVRT